MKVESYMIKVYSLMNSYIDVVHQMYISDRARYASVSESMMHVYVDVIFLTF